MPRLLVATLLSGCVAAPGHQGAATSNFNGTVFFNTLPAEKGLLDVITFGLGSLTKSEPWPAWRNSPTQTIEHQRVADGLSVTFINHSTFLLQVNGLNILTDPIYSDRASPFQWAGPKRVQAPGVKLVDLPPIDVVLISHNHYDHLDEATLKQLVARQPEPPLILSGLGNGRLFDEFGFTRHQDLGWEDSLQLGDVEFVFTEARHRSGRGMADQMKTLWGAFVIKTPAGNIYFAGDTGYGPHFKAAGDNHGPFALSLLPIGAYQPRWFMADVHTNPAEAVTAHQDLRSAQSIGMHYGTFQLTYEAIDTPVQELQQALADNNLDPAQFWVLPTGTSRRLPGPATSIAAAEQKPTL